jgi:PAS domain S-box-containing protein
MDSHLRRVLSAAAAGQSLRDVARELDLPESEVRKAWQRLEERFAELDPTTPEEFREALDFERARRRALEAEVWAADSRLRALMDLSPEGVLLVDGRSGEILAANVRAETFLGYGAGELVGRSVEEHVPEDVRERHVALRHGFLNSIRKRDMGYHPPILARRRDGSMITLDIGLTATPATDDVMVVCRPCQPGDATAETNRFMGSGESR